jgi:hypothetical protein
VTIENFQAADFDRLYRSCGNCSKQYKRVVVVRSVQVTRPGLGLVGLNVNYGDRATLSGLTFRDDPQRRGAVCDRYIGNSTGDAPPKVGSGPDGRYCLYDPKAVSYP